MGGMTTSGTTMTPLTWVLASAIVTVPAIRKALQIKGKRGKMAFKKSLKEVMRDISLIPNLGAFRGGVLSEKSRKSFHRTTCGCSTDGVRTSGPSSPLCYRGDVLPQPITLTVSSPCTIAFSCGSVTIPIAFSKPGTYTISRTKPDTLTIFHATTDTKPISSSEPSCLPPARRRDFCTE